MATEQQPHFLLIPYSEQGHINPMLSLAYQLLRLRCLVTFVKADRHLPPATSDSDDGAADVAAAEPASRKSQPPLVAPSGVHSAMAHERLRFVTLPVRNKALCVDPKTMTRHEIFKKTLAGLEERQDLVAAIVEESKASSSPITCIISDYIIWKWVRHIARAHRLRSAVLSGSNALSFYIFYLYALGKDEDIEELLVSQFGMPSQKDDTAYVGLVGVKDSLEMRLQKRKVFASLYEGIEEASTILINSFEALESPLALLLRASGLNVSFIGPCLPEWHKDDTGVGSSIVQEKESTFIEDTTCLTWLDQQKKGSVVYVSFGSEGEIEAKQVEEIELGIEKSGCKYLWVIRSNAIASCRPLRGLCEKSNCQGNGLIVSWAPQTRVLQHHAVGGFLTHSGWNSTLESLTFGVPMLCLPILGDQPYIANFVQNYLQVGIRLSVGQDGLVHREEVARGMQAIMQGHFSQKVAQVLELAQLAKQVAHFNLTSFVQASRISHIH